MCALAATGQLGGAQMCELNEHIGSCQSCRDFLEEITQVSVQALPLLESSYGPAQLVAPPEGIRGRFLSRLAREAKRFEGGTSLEIISGSDSQPGTIQMGVERKRESSEPSSRRITISRLGWSAFAAASCLAIGMVGFFLGKGAIPKGTRATISTEPAIVSEIFAEPSGRIQQLEAEKSGLEERLHGMRQELSNAKLEQDSLASELRDTKAKLAAYLEQNREESASSLASSQSARNEIKGLQSQIERLNRRLSDSDVKLGVQLQTTEELTSKLEATEEELQRTRELTAARSEPAHHRCLRRRQPGESPAIVWTGLLCRGEVSDFLCLRLARLAAFEYQHCFPRMGRKSRDEGNNA
jgi:hypothetical protein